MIVLKSPTELAAMKRAGKVVARAHQVLAEKIRPGMKTRELDEIVEAFFEKEGAVSAFKGYQGYPANICVSRNEQVVHGIPGELVLEEGDIVSVDIGAIVDGFHGDSAWTYPVGRISPERRRMLEVGEGALYAGIEKAVVGNRLSDISHAVQSYVEARGYSVVRDLVGHGIGRAMHEAPQVPNFGPPGRGPRLKAGMTLAIEPMINAGGYEVEVLEDEWTVVTADGSDSVHFEHTVAITPDGPWILTALE
mgnify:CR=1 FL=1